MSTGLDCRFVGVSGKWYYFLEQGRFNDDDSLEHTEEYDSYGPFSSNEAAIQHLRDNHANPGGWTSHETTEDKLGDYERILIKKARL